MRILAAADFHEDEELIDAIVEEANTGDYDMFLAAGDFVTPDHYERVMGNVNIPRLACTGNWDFDFTPPDEDDFDHLYNYMKVDYEDYKIAIIGAVFPDDFQQDIIDWVDGFDDRKLLFMSHYPPKRLGDRAVSGNNAGMDGFRELIMKTKPAAWFCGHIHEAFGQYHLMKTEVFNCASIESRKAVSVTLGDDGVEEHDGVDLA
jgi:Icc-related predicted phosphoesterase